MSKRSLRSGNPDLTIVGGQPNRCSRVTDVEVPAGFEIVLIRAASDDSFKCRLLADRAAAISELAVPLRPSEQRVLYTTSNETLELMIDRVGHDNPQNRSFRGKVAAAVTSLAHQW